MPNILLFKQWMRLHGVMKCFTTLTVMTRDSLEAAFFVTGFNKGALKLRCNAVLMCVCVYDIECNWVNSKCNVRSVLLEAYAMRPTCLTSK